MIFQEWIIERPLLESASELEGLTPDQADRIKQLDLKFEQYTAMLHTFKKKWFGTNLYPGSHNESKMKGTVTSTDTL